MNETCGAWHRFEPDRCRRAAPGLRVCGGCRDRMVRALTAMPRLHAALGAVLVPARASGEGRGGKAAAAPWPISASAAEARDAIASGLRADARWVRRQRSLDGPASDHPAAVGAWLLPHADYMLRDTEAAPYVAEKYVSLRSQAMAVIDPQPRSEFPLPGARCPEQGPCGLCGGVLWATVIRDRPLAVACADCGATYGAAQLLRLGHRITTLARA